MNLKKLPKIELHCHLDGSLRCTTVMELMKKEKLDLDGINMEKVKELVTAPIECESLNEYLKRFELPVKLMQNKENIERIAYELMEDSAKENIKYIEIRFAPLLHKEKGLSTKEIIESVVNGVKRGEEDFNIKGGVILCLLRHMEVETGEEVIESGKEFLQKGVVALDLAGGEEEGFVPKYKELFDKARSYGFNVTIHAGETGFSKNVIDAIDILKAQRIGHGIAILKDKESFEKVKENKIVLEMCPKSNVQTKAIKEYKNHPIKRFLEGGIKATICTDNNLVSDVTLTEEFYNTNKIQGLGLEDYKEIYENGVYGAFCTADEKIELLKQLNKF